VPWHVAKRIAIDEDEVQLVEGEALVAHALILDASSSETVQVHYYVV